MKITRTILLCFCLLVVCLHVWGTLYPSHYNWGFHFFGFYDTPFSLIALGVLMIAAIPGVQRPTLQKLERLFRFISRAPLLIIFLLLATGILVGGYFFSAKLHLLGDGALLLRSLSKAEWGPNIIQSFDKQPLMYFLFRSALNLHVINSPAETYDLYIWVDRISAIVFLGIIFWCVRTLKTTSVEKVLLGCFVFFGGGSQFFFGYIENYVLQYVGAMGFIVSGWFALERRASILSPILWFILIVGLHLGNLFFFPSLVMLLLPYFKRRKALMFVIIGGIGSFGFLAMYLLGFFTRLIGYVSSFKVNFLPFFTASGGFFPYPMFSFTHLFDWFNMHMLISPLALVTVIVLLTTFPKERFRKNPTLYFLVTASCCGLLFTWIVNTSLGMPRDWDVLAGFLAPLMVLTVYLLYHSLSKDSLQYVLTIILIISGFHWAAWVGVNSNEQRHLARIKLLNNPQMLSLGSQMFYDEALANFFFDHGNYVDARAYYEHFISIESTNPRIIGNISDVYRKLGEKQKYFESLQRAVQLNSRDPGIYSNLGVEYASRKDTNLAIEYNEKAIALDPRQEKAHANLGILYAAKKNYRLAKEHFVTAIDLGMRDPVVYKYAADLSFFLDEYQDAIKYYDLYLSLRPDDQKVRGLRERARESLQHIQTPQQ